MVLILMKFSLSSKLRKQNNQQRERERESYTRAHTLSHIQKRAYRHYCSSMVCYSEGIGGSGRGKHLNLNYIYIQQHIYSHIRSKYTPAKWQRSMVIVFDSFHLVSCCRVYQSSVIPCLFCHSHCLQSEAIVHLRECCGWCGQFWY